MNTNETDIVISYDFAYDKENILIRNKTGLIGRLIEDKSNALIQRADKHICNIDFADLCKEIDIRKKNDYVTKDQCQQLFTQVIPEFRLPFEFVEHLVTQYVNLHSTTLPVWEERYEKKVVNCGDAEIVLITGHYLITGFSDFIYKMFKRRHGTMDNMFFPNLAKRFFILPEGYINKFNMLFEFPEEKWREALNKIKSKEEVLIIRR